MRQKACFKPCLIVLIVFLLIITILIGLIFLFIRSSIKWDDELLTYLRYPGQQFALLSSDCKIEDTFFAIDLYHEDNSINLYKTEEDFKNKIPTKKVKKYQKERKFNTKECEYKFENGLHCYYLDGKCILKSLVKFNKVILVWEDYYIFGTNDFNCSLVKDGKVLLQSYLMFVGGPNLVVVENDVPGSVKIYDKDLNILYSCQECRYSEGVYSVKKNGKWGFVDEDGNEFIKPQYDNYYYPDGFVHGKCFVGKGPLCYIIDKNNNILFSCQGYNDRFEPTFLEDGRFLVIVDK